MIRIIRNLCRLCYIALVLVRYDVLMLRKSGKSKGERISKALEALGPSFIKLGQTLSTRSDLIGDDIADALSNLRDRLPPFSSARARKTIESEFGKPLDALFLTFENTPIAAASIAQVHKATTMDGKHVAVKILRPNIARAFQKDLDLFFWLARMVQWFMPSYRRLKPREVVQTFAASVALELDLRYEAAAATEMAKNITADAGFRVPTVEWHLTSESVMVLEWVEGIPLNDVEALRLKGFDCNLLLSRLSENFFKHVFRDGFFHADMHPGNLFVDAKGDIVAVDFGIMGRLDWQTRLYVAEILRGFLAEDYIHVAKVHFRAGYVPISQSVENFALACMAIAKPILNKPLHEVSVGRLLGQLFKVTETFQMETRPELLLLQKTMVVVEGVGRMLNPQINMWEMARQPIADWAKENMGIRGKMRETLNMAHDLAERAPALIRRLEYLIANSRL